MKWIRGRRPSPAMIVALVALFVSLSGVSYGVATGFIDSRELKNNEVRSLDIRNNTIRTRDLRNNEVRGIDIRNSTIRGQDVGLNTLTGDDVLETSLGKVASATTADTATTATSSDSVGGLTLRHISYAGEAGSGFVEVFNHGGLVLEARCVAGPFLEVQANPTTADGYVSSQFGGFANTDNDFDPGDDVLVSDGVSNEGQIAYVAANGDLVTVHALTRQAANGVRGTNDCGFFGVASAG